MRTSASARSLSTMVAVALILPLGSMFAPIEATYADYSQCSDGIDNDSDGQIDYPEDANCSAISDNMEWADNGIFVSVTDDKDSVAPGNALIYQISLKQQREPVTLVDVTFHVPFQSGVTYVSNDGVIAGGTTATWYKVAVFKDNIRHLSVHAVVSPYAKNGQLLVTRVVANGSTASETTIVSNNLAIPYAQNQLGVTVSDHRDNAQPGDVLDYLVTVRNPERNAVTVDVRSSIPASLRVLSANGADFVGNELVWKNITINPNQERTFSFRAQVDSRIPKSYSIQVVARAGNVVASDRTVAGGIPYSLFSSISDGRDNAGRGDLLTYVIHIDNTSGRLDPDASIDAALPIYGEFVSAAEGGVWDGKNVRWLHMQVAPGGSRDLRFTVRVRSDAPDGTLLRGSVSAQGFTATDVTKVGGGQAGYYGNTNYEGRGPSTEVPHGDATITVRKTADRSVATPGSTVRYTLKVKNIEGRELHNVYINDAYDASAFQVTDNGSGDVQNGRIVWIIDSLGAGETRSFTYSGQVSRSLRSGASVLNTARAYVGGSDVGLVATASSNVDIGQYLLPQTGIEDFFGPLENTAQFLSPIASAADGNGLPMVVWLLVIVTGLVSGGVLAKKYSI
ncbi:DUF11 domain-containing protein [Candidatus Peribacteria bacterium]|nr:DUF11 domain-containing protein [Candidatus Peribacteria bacterium]